MSSKLFDVVYTYQFIKRLATPFNEWDAFKLGIIDENGKVLRKRQTLKTIKEKEAWGYFDRLVANLKKLLEKLPGGKSKIASYAAALLLLREGKELESLEDEELEAILEQRLEPYLAESRKFSEEIANVVGSGNIAGTGVGVQGEPPAKKKTLIIKKVLKRKFPNA